MNYNILGKILRLLLLMMAQILVCNNIHLLGYASPLIIGYMIVAMRRDESRVSLLLWGFATGFVYDMFSNTAGMASAGMTLLAMIQPSLALSMSPHETEDEMRISVHEFGFWNYTMYVFFSMMILHTVYYFLDAFMLSDIKLTVLSSFVSSAIATVIVVCLDMMLSSERNK